MSVILLVEDNPHIIKINSEMLTMRGYDVIQASNRTQCLEALSLHPVDLVVLDIMLPDGNGLELCRTIKEQYCMPVLFLSALGENRDVVDGLRAGGDDYLAKPYDLEVLLARIEARLRQRQQQYVCYGDLKLDLESRIGTLGGNDLLLTQKEFSVLLLLIRNAGTFVSKQRILQEIWNTQDQEDSRVLWTLISRLRSKLNAGGSHLEITSERSHGYMLEHS